MDLNETLTFVKVVRLGSFSAAARVLGLPVSTVSTRVARLEQRLGVTLLQRTTRRLSLTEKGQAYFDHAAQGLELMEVAESAVLASKQEPQGRLRVSAPVDLGYDGLARLMGRFRTVHPAVQVELILTDRRVDLVGEGIDVAIRAGHLPDSSLMARQVGIACWEPFATARYLKQAPALLQPNDLTQHLCLQFTMLGKDQWTLRKGDEEVTVPLPGQMVANDLNLIRAMALADQGVALLPRYATQASDKSLRPLLPVLPGWQAKADPVHLVYPRQRFVSATLRAFVDLAVREMQPWFALPA